MKRKQIVIALLYMLLLLGCLLIVLIIGHLAGDYNKDRTQQRSESTASCPAEGSDWELPVDLHTPADAEIDESQAMEAAAGDRHRRPRHAGLKEEPISELPQEEPYIPPVIMVSSDHHYISATMHDNGTAFWKMVQDEDGKISQYSDEMMDALLAEAITNHPSALVLAGDLTLNG